MAPLVWFITGTSNGLGAELAKAVLKRGDKVIATARSPISRLSGLEQAGASIMEFDVTWNEVDVENAVQNAIAVYGHVDVVVPNAGYAEFVCLEDLTQNQWAKQLNVNFFGVTTLVRAILPHFRTKRSGTVAFMNSIFSHDSSPFNGPYSTTKHAISAYSKTINEELNQFNIHSISFDLGMIKTDFLHSANYVTPSQEDYTSSFKDFQAGAEAVYGHQLGDPEKCVERIVDVVKGEGFAKGKPMPKVAPLGSEARGFVRKRAEELIRVCDEWKDLSDSVDFEERP